MKNIIDFFGIPIVATILFALAAFVVSELIECPFILITSLGFAILWAVLIALLIHERNK